MSIPTRTRGEVVNKLKALLDTTLKAEENLVEATFNYLPTNPDGLSPIAAVVPLSTDRMGSTSRRRKMDPLVAIYIMVLYSSSAAAIDEEAAWEALNDIEHATAETLNASNRVDGYWMSITYNETSAISVAVFDNHGYLFEAIPLRIQVF